MAEIDVGNKKKKTVLGGKNEGNDEKMNIKLTIKELLNVSSDWKEINKKNPTSGSLAIGALPMDF